MECFISSLPTQQLKLTSAVLKVYMAAFFATSDQNPINKGVNFQGRWGMSTLVKSQLLRDMECLGTQ